MGLSEEAQTKDVALFGLPMKWIALVTLAIQNSTLNLVITYSRSETSERPYLNSTAVFLNELLKVLICIAMILYGIRSQKDSDSSIQNTCSDVIQTLKSEVLGKDAWKLSIPALLYTVQNNLLYIAASYLDAATLQITYQLKILTTALCAIFLLNTSLSKRKWASLVLLVTGVVLTQVQKFSINRNDPEDNQIKSASTLTIGLFAIFMACMSSGLSGVYFEKILKGSTTSLWVRNLQLSLFSLAISAGGIIMFDMGAVKENGFFYGYTLSTWGAIVSQAAGGIIVALVVKYADNILKGFATSISIIISSIVSIWMFDFYPGAYFLVGAVLVIYASITYGSDPNKASHIDKLLIPFTEKSGREDLD